MDARGRRKFETEKNVIQPWIQVGTDLDFFFNPRSLKRPRNKIWNE